MKTKNQSNSGVKLLKIIGILCLLFIIAGATLFVLEKKGVTNLYTSQNNTNAEMSRFPVDNEGNRLPNTVDYGPSKEEDSVPIPDKSINQVESLPTNPELTVVITNSRKSDGLYLIKAVIYGTDSATCSGVMTKGSLTATASSGATIIEGQYSCKDLSIPMAQLTETGEWNLELIVTDKNGATATSNEKVIL